MFSENSTINFAFIIFLVYAHFTTRVLHFDIDLSTSLHSQKAFDVSLNIDSNQHTWLCSLRKSMNENCSQERTNNVRVKWHLNFCKRLVLNEPCSRLLFSVDVSSIWIFVCIKQLVSPAKDINHFKSNYLRSCEDVKFLVAATKLCEFSFTKKGENEIKELPANEKRAQSFSDVEREKRQKTKKREQEVLSRKKAKLWGIRDNMQKHKSIM